MPGFLLHVGATVLCAHGGQAQPTAPNPRVLVSGQPTSPWRAVRRRRLRASRRRPPPTARASPRSGHRGDARHVERAAAAAARQPGDLRADRHAADDRRRRRRA